MEERKKELAYIGAMLRALLEPERTLAETQRAANREYRRIRWIRMWNSIRVTKADVPRILARNAPALAFIGIIAVALLFGSLLNG